MKIVICVLNLYGGGAERVASLWTKGFYEDGHEVTLLLDNSKITYDIPNVEIRFIGKQNCNIFERYINWYKQLRFNIQDIRPDVFISVNHPWAIITKLASYGLSTKIISTEHNSYEKPSYIKMSFADKLHKYFFNRFVDAVTVLTQADKDYIGKRLNNVYVLPNPLAYKPQTSISTKKNIILSVGRINSWHVKGFDLLIKGWASIAQQHPNWKLKIVGYGETKNINYLISLAPELISNNQLIFEDFTPNVIELYKESSIYVLSSRYEGFGMSLLEAMSQSCACIACDYNGRQREIITDKVDGLIIEPDNCKAISNAIDKLILNEDIRNTYSKNAINRSNDFTLDKIMKIWNNIIQ